MQRTLSIQEEESSKDMLIGWYGWLVLVGVAEWGMMGTCVRADLGGHLKYSRRWSGVRAGVLLGAQGAVRREESRGGL